MINGHIINTTFQASSPDSALITPAVAGFNEINLITKQKPLRYYKSSLNPVVSGITIPMIVFGSGPDVSAMFIDNINVDTIDIYTGPAGGPFTPLAGYTGLTITQESYTGRYKKYITFTTPLTDDVIALVVPSGTGPVKAPLNAVTLGAVTMFSSTDEKEIPGGFRNNVAIDRIQPVTSQKFEGSSSEFTLIGEPRVTITIPDTDLIRSTQEKDFMNIVKNNMNPMVFFENGPDDSAAYTCMVDIEKTNKFSYKVRQVVTGKLVLLELL